MLISFAVMNGLFCVFILHRLVRSQSLMQNAGLYLQSGRDEAKKKKPSEFRPVKRIVTKWLVMYPARTKGLLNSHRHSHKGVNIF